MTDWEQATLATVLRREGGSIKTGPFGTTLKANEYSTVGVPVISVGEVGYGSFRIRVETPRVDKLVTERLPEYVLQAGDIVFGRKGAVDRSAWVAESQAGWFLGSDGIRLRLPHAVSSRFISYQLQMSTTREWLLQHASGSTMLSLNQGIFGRVPVTLPPLPEQRAIAEVLGALDDKIAANIGLADTLSRRASAEYVRATKSTESTGLLSDLVTTQYGLTASANDLPGPKFLRVTDINKKPWIEWDRTPNCTVSQSDLDKYRVGYGDILVARMADPGKAAFVDDEAREAVFASYLVRLRAHNPLNALYIYYFLRSNEYQRYADGAMQGSVQKNMNAKVIVATNISLPTSQKIARFNTTVTALRASMCAALKENRTLAATRDALLPQLMSGALRIKDAEKLLEEVV